MSLVIVKNSIVCLLFLALFGCAKPPVCWFDLVRNNDVSAVKEIIADIDVNAENEFGATALHLASQYGYKQLVEILIAEGASVAQKNEKGYQPIDYAIAKGHHGVVEMLLISGASNRLDEYTQEPSPLISSVINKHHDILRTLLKYGFDENNVNKEGQTALLAAVSVGDVDSVRILLEHGANPDTLDIDNQPVLGDAVSLQQIEIVRLLLEAGAKERQPIEKSESMVWISLSEKNHETMKLLIDHYGADFNYENEGIGLLDYAVCLNDAIAVDILAQYAGKTQNTRAIYGSALNIAILSEYCDIMEILLKKGADINYMSKEGLTPLAIGISTKDRKIVEILVSHGANTEQKIHGKRPKEYAESINACDVVEVLDEGEAARKTEIKSAP